VKKRELMKCKLLLIAIVFLIFIYSASAEFNVGGAYTYLASKSVNGSYNNNIIDTSLALLAFDAIGRDASREASYLRSQESEQKCWPKQNCNVKDTAFAIVALSAAGLDMSSEERWLKNAQSAASLSGTWYLEIATSDTGSCKISYEQNNQTVEKEIKITKGFFPECGNTTFFNINKCLVKGVINAMPSLDLDVNCDMLSSVDSVTIMYRAENSFYLVDEESASRAKVTISNGCFGKTAKTACDYESSLYANLALHQIQSTLDTEFYLRQGYDATNPLHNAILFIITGYASYAKELANKQRNSGSWNENVYQTAFGVLALKDSEYAENVENAKKYFERRQLADYSLGNVQDTALTLYAAYADASGLPECFNSEIGLCAKQAGVCEGSYEICSNNTFLGCDDAIYNSFNKSYEAEEITCDEVDNDCDGNVDTGCECIAGEKRPCGLQYGVCNGTIEICSSDGKWPGCDYSKVEGYEESEKNCKDDKDNDCDDTIDFVDDDCSISSICNGDGKCDKKKGEDSNNCPEDCNEEDNCNNGVKDEFEEGPDCGGVCEEPCEITTKDQCNGDGTCDQETESSEFCPDECTCGDNVCDDYELNSENCAEDCEGAAAEAVCGDGSCDAGETAENCARDCEGAMQQEGGSGTIWYVLLIIAALGVIGYIVYRKKYAKLGKEKKTSWKEETTKSPVFQSLFGDKKEEKTIGKGLLGKSFVSRGKSDVEKELEKSIAEAKKLIGKEK